MWSRRHSIVGRDLWNRLDTPHGLPYVCNRPASSPVEQLPDYSVYDGRTDYELGLTDTPDDPFERTDYRYGLRELPEDED